MPWSRKLRSSSDDPNAKVRFQLALSLGEWKQPAAGQALAKLAMKEADSPAMRGAVISSLMPHLAAFAAQVQGEPVFMEAILSTALGEQKHDLILDIARPHRHRRRPPRRAVAARLAHAASGVARKPCYP